MRPEPVFVIDTREQQPYRFPRSEVRALPTGDYSLAGLEDRVTVERKSKGDLYTSLGRERDRFEREIKRMAGYDYAALVVEASLEELLRPPAFSLMSPRSVVNTVISWSIKYGIHVYFAGNRKRGNTLTQRVLEKYWQHHARGCGR